MINDAETYYRVIAESMIQGIPEEWTSAKFEAIFFPGSSTYEAEYVRKADGVARSFRPGDDGSSTFRSLRTAFKAAGKPLWGRAIFELRSDGTFEMHYGYERCDENGATIFDGDEELKRLKDRKRRLSQPGTGLQ